MLEAVTPVVPPAQQVGLAGEHYFGMRLAMFGITPALLPARTPDADVIATDRGSACTLQVKTMGGAGRGVVDVHPDRILRPNFLVIVALNMANRKKYGAEPGEPTAYVVPRGAVLKLWELAGYRHPQRSSLQLSRPGALEFLEPYQEAWGLIVRALQDMNWEEPGEARS